MDTPHQQGCSEQAETFRVNAPIWQMVGDSHFHCTAT